jgi:hypothetical protein
MAENPENRAPLVGKDITMEQLEKSMTEEEMSLFMEGIRTAYGNPPPDSE